MRNRALALPIVLILAACGPGGPTPSPSPTPAAEGLYLRAWSSQALPPAFTFANLPRLTISDDRLIDGNVAVPAIYPGPLLIMPNVRGISDQGQGLIIARALDLGLLGERTDFTGGQPMPGAELANIELVVDGTRRILLGEPQAIVRCVEARCVPQPGTPEAFALFWQELGDLEPWLGPQLGPQTGYVPERLAVAVIQPRPADLQPNRLAWPLGAFADFGEPWVEPDSRCATVGGEELDSLLPALMDANQLTRFVDSAEHERSLLARLVVPGEPAPCGDDG